MAGRRTSPADLGATAKFTTLSGGCGTHVDRLRQVKREMMLPGVLHISSRRARHREDQGRGRAWKARDQQRRRRTSMVKLYNHVLPHRACYRPWRSGPKRENARIMNRSTCYTKCRERRSDERYRRHGATSGVVVAQDKRAAQPAPRCCSAGADSSVEAKGGEYCGRSAWLVRAPSGEDGRTCWSDDSRSRDRNGEDHERRTVRPHIQHAQGKMSAKGEGRRRDHRDRPRAIFCPGRRGMARAGAACREIDEGADMTVGEIV